MDMATASAIREDFLAWSGGFPPESGQQIFVYVETARPTNSEPDEVAALLRLWMQRDAFLSS